MATSKVNELTREGTLKFSQFFFKFCFISRIWRSLVHTDSQLIFNCGYENEMNSHETHALARQLEFCHGVNRRHPTPFFFNFTNLQSEGLLHRMLLKRLPTLHNKSMPIRVTEQFIPDSIDEERLVYLTPNSPNLLTEFKPNDVYVIGGLVDKGAKKPHSLAKAKRLGLRTACLPLDRFVRWKASHKSLTLDQVTKILLELKVTGDMYRAVQHVPGRKVHQ